MSSQSSVFRRSASERDAEGSVTCSAQESDSRSPSVEEIVEAVEIPPQSEPRNQRRTTLEDSGIRARKCTLTVEEFRKAKRLASAPGVTVRRPTPEQSVFDAPSGFFAIHLKSLEGKKSFSRRGRTPPRVGRGSSSSFLSPRVPSFAKNPSVPFAEEAARKARQEARDQAVAEFLASDAFQEEAFARMNDLLKAWGQTPEGKAFARSEGTSWYNLGLFRAQQVLSDRFLAGEDLPEPCDNPDELDTSIYYPNGGNSAGEQPNAE
ncbi:unnamed protein product [Cuscuta campestris]|uniref:Uncharacterized protein n=1 Tax=Cuscuta campestris TaxID=132261 RepID=A0A484K5B7_9ASTE|nr:unnamed protein product [Cuscuta campestris]